MLQPRLPQLRKESDALYPICLTFQLSLSNHHSPQFLEYFDTSLRKFRSELARSTSLSDGTLTAGLLLCSIGVRYPDMRWPPFHWLAKVATCIMLIEYYLVDAWIAVDNASRRHA